MYKVPRDVSSWDEFHTFEVTVENTRDISAKIEIRRSFSAQYWTLKPAGGHDADEKVDLDTVKFNLTLEPRSTRQFTYELQTFQRDRRQSWKQNRSPQETGGVLLRAISTPSQLAVPATIY